MRKLRTYQVPPDMKEKEKIIGGLLNINQFFWLLGGFILGILLFIVTFVTTKIGVLSIIVGILGLSTGIPFALIKKMDGTMTLWEYIKRKRDLKKKSSKLINKRKDVC